VVYAVADKQGLSDTELKNVIRELEAGQKGVLNMTKRFMGEAASIAYEMAESLYKNGIINDDAMREFDDVCLLPEQAALQRIRDPEQPISTSIQIARNGVW
jgi:hypothetical protein